MSFDPDAFLADCEILTGGPVAYRDLPVAGDEDLERQLDGAYGVLPDRFTFALARCRFAHFNRHLAADDRRALWQISEAGPRFYERLEDEWRAAYAEDLAEVDEPWELDCDYPDGHRRAEIVRGYITDLKQGRALTPLVCDLHGPFDLGIHLMDGYHRLAATAIVNRGIRAISRKLPVSFYYLLADPD